MSLTHAIALYLGTATLAVVVSGQILRANGRALLVAACPEGNLPGAVAAMRLIVAVYHLFAFGFVFVIASSGNSVP